MIDTQQCKWNDKRVIGLRKKHWVLWGFVCIGYLVIGIMINWRNHQVEVTIKNDHLTLSYNHKTVNEVDLPNDTFTTIRGSISHDRSFSLLQWLRPEESFQINSTTNTPTVLLNQQLATPTLPWTNLFKPTLSFFSSPNTEADQAGMAEFVATSPNRDYQLEIHTVNPTVIQLSLGNTHLFLRPKWHHEAIISTDNHVISTAELPTRNWLELFRITAGYLFILSLASIPLWIIGMLLARGLGSIYKGQLRSINLSQFIPRQVICEIIAVEVIAIIFFGISVYLGQNTLQNTPHSQDEVSYLFQSQLFAASRLYDQLPEPIRPFFNHEFIYNQDKRFGIFPPGASIILALGQIAQIPHLINPSIGSLSLVLLYLIIRKIASVRVAIISITLLLISPMYLFMSASYFSHPTALFFVLTTILLLLYQRFWLSGLTWGLIFITRPYTAVLILIALTILIIARQLHVLRSKKDRKIIVINLFKFIGGASLPITALLFYDYILTGSPFKLPYMVYSIYNKLGFGQRGNEWPNTFTPTMGWQNLNINLYALGDMLLPWPLISTLTAAGLAFLSKRRGLVAQLSLIFLVVSIGHIFYFGPGTFYGPRFWYEGAIVLFPISAIGIDTFYQHLKQNSNRTISLMIILTLATPLVIYSQQQLKHLASTLADYNGMHPVNLPVQPESPSLIFISGQNSWQEYARYFIQQDPSMTDLIIYARNEGQHNVPPHGNQLDNRLLQGYFPNRNLYLLNEDHLEPL